MNAITSSYVTGSSVEHTTTFEQYDIVTALRKVAKADNNSATALNTKHFFSDHIVHDKSVKKTLNTLIDYEKAIFERVAKIHSACMLIGGNINTDIPKDDYTKLKDSLHNLFAFVSMPTDVTKFDIMLLLASYREIVAGTYTKDGNIRTLSEKQFRGQLEFFLRIWLNGETIAIKKNVITNELITRKAPAFKSESNLLKVENSNIPISDKSYRETEEIANNVNMSAKDREYLKALSDDIKLEDINIENMPHLSTVEIAEVIAAKTC